MSETSKAPGPGAAVGSRYTLEAVIGSGAMGQVWRATTREGDQVAIKILRPDLTNDAEFVGRFLQEGQILTKVHHPSVVAVRDLVAEGSQLALVLDLVDGPDLRHELTRRGTFPPALAAETVDKVLAGVGAIHAAGIIHRDLKPENVLLSPAAAGIEPKISDFGIARMMESGPAARTTAILGTPEYIAPEVADGRIPTAQTDLYSVGIMFYELLTGVTPFAGGPAMAVMRRHVEQLPGRPDGLPDDLWNFMSGLLAKDPAARPASAEKARETLRPLVAGLAASPALTMLSVPPAPVPREQPTMMGTRPLPEPGALIQATGSDAAPVRQKQRRTWLIATIGVVLVLLIGGAATAWSLQRQGESPEAAPPTSSAPNSPSPTETTPTPTPLATVPTVLGLPVDTATQQLEALGFTVEVKPTSDDTQAAGVVLGVRPEAGTELQPDATVTITVNSAPSPSPSPSPSVSESQSVGAAGSASPVTLTLKELCNIVDYSDHCDDVQMSVGSKAFVAQMLVRTAAYPEWRPALKVSAGTCSAVHIQFAMSADDARYQSYGKLRLTREDGAPVVATVKKGGVAKLDVTGISSAFNIEASSDNPGGSLYLKGTAVCTPSE